VPSTYIPGRSADEVARAYGISPEKVIKLGSNENALGPSPRAVEAIKRHLNKINVYPSHGYAELKDAIAHYIGCSAERIIVGNGSDDLLNTLVRNLYVLGDQAIIPVPTYTYYESSSKPDAARAFTLTGTKTFQSTLTTLLQRSKTTQS